MSSTTPKPRSTLASIFTSLAMARLVVFFLVHPGERAHLRELMRRTRLPSASLQTELRRLAETGALVREEDGGRAVFFARDEHPAWRAWILLLRSCAHPADVLREALADADGLDAAFVFGSVAAGGAAAHSDVDVFLVGDRGSRERAGRLLSEASLLVGRDIGVAGYERAELDSRVATGNRFVREVMRSPRIWLTGSPAALGSAEAA